MTKLDVDLGVKKAAEEMRKEEVKINETNQDSRRSPEEVNVGIHPQKLHEILVGVGMDYGDDTEMPHEEIIGVDFAFINRIGRMQFILAMISSICLFLSMLVTGFSFFRFTSSAWATYLLTVAYVAIRAGRWKSYAHVVAYTGMATFQTVVYMSSLCWLLYSLYALDYQLNVYRSAHMLMHDVSLFLVVSEILAVMGTVFTGLFGLMACCRGLGKLLHAQERMIQAQNERSSQITVRPLV